MRGRHTLLALASSTLLAVVLLAAERAGAAGRPPDTLKFREPLGFTWAELALLPEYCYDAQGILYGLNESPRTQYWLSQLGPDFIHIHHYCQILQDLLKIENSALAPKQQNQVMANIERNLIYIMRTCLPSNPLYPEFLLRFGDFHVMRKEFPQASEYYARARKMKPDYWPAYVRWIDVLTSLKLNTEAKALAAEGLRHAPNAKALVDIYRRLGGDPARIEAVLSAPGASLPATPASIPASAAASASSH